MKWYHFSVEYFEDLRNVNHCEFLIMKRREDSGKYELQNTLRTWSQLKKDRAAAGALANIKELPKLGDEDAKIVTEKEREKESKREEAKIPKRKQWGGCPNGCEHGRAVLSRTTSSSQAATSTSKDASTNGRPSTTRSASSSTTLPLRPGQKRTTSSTSPNSSDDDAATLQSLKSNSKPRPTAPINTRVAQESEVSSPDGTPSYITLESRNRHHLKTPSHTHTHHHHHRLLREGRDFGGSASGHTSQAEDEDEDDVKDGEKGNKAGPGESGMGVGAMADALGDQSDDDEEEGEYECESCAANGNVGGEAKKEGGVEADVY